jgi:sugar-specific transcriptional regulator TrmB
METKILEEIGFSQGEVKVYFSLLELGESTIGPLAKKAGITAAKVYPIIEKLTKKGLASSVIKSGTKHFNASSPKQIINYLNERNLRINEQKKQIKELIPSIEEKRRLSKEQQKAEVYETLQGMRTLYDEILEDLRKNKENFTAFSLGEEEYKYPEVMYFFQEYDKKRESLGIKTKLLSHISQKYFFKKASKEWPYLKVRFLDFKLPTGVIIYGNKVATITWGEIPTAFVIQSKKISKSYRDFFEEMWKNAKK